MITTRFGSKVEIIKGDLENGVAMIKRMEDGKTLVVELNTLVADGGFVEIEKEIKRVNELKKWE